MTLLAPQRRFLALALIAALIVPAAAMPFLPRLTVSVQENRRLAPPPAAPRSSAQWRAAPREVDAFLADHFGFRAPMMKTAVAGWRRLGGKRTDAGAVEGRDGWMFLRDGLLASTGQAVDEARVADYGAFVCELGARLRVQGAKLAFSPAPSPAEIYPEAAPAWAGPARRPTEYDLVLAKAKACGVLAVDLRPALIAAKREGLIYRKLDSHWTLRGSLAAYNRLVEALGRPEWRTPPQSLTWRTIVLTNGDLPRMAGRADTPEVVEIHNRIDLPAGVYKRPLPGPASSPMAPFIVETGKPGPTLLIIGDSFTRDPAPPYFAPFVGKLAWIHQEACAFDWTVMAQIRPDYVLLAPAERETRCHGARPLGWAGAGNN